jgi:hypothetical protein
MEYTICREENGAQQRQENGAQQRQENAMEENEEHTERCLCLDTWKAASVLVYPFSLRYC